MRKIKIGLFIVIILFLYGAIFSLIPCREESSLRLGKACLIAPFGYDAMGRNLFLYLSRALLNSFSLALAVTLLTLISSFLIAPIIEPKHRGSIVALSILDGFKAVPAIVLALFLVSLGGPASWKVILSLTVMNIPNVSRTIAYRYSILKDESYVAIARGAGRRGYEVFFRHILPHLLPLIFEEALALMCSSIVIEASLSYLGAGLKPTTPSIGGALSEGRRFLLTAPRLVLIPAFILMLLTIALVMIFEGLSELDSSSHASS